MQRCSNSDLGCFFASEDRTEIESHEAACDFVCVTCDYCSRIFLRNHYQIHQEMCLNFPIYCHKCNIQIQRRDLPKHLEKSCIYSVLTACEACSQTFLLVDYKEHKEICGEFLEICQCGYQYKRKAKDSHGILDCTYRQLHSTKENFVKDVDELKSMLGKIEVKTKKERSYLNLQCTLCDSITCDVITKNCSACRQRFCRDCSIKIFKSCKKCSGKYCESCSTTFLDFDFCLNCRPVIFSKAVADFRALKMIK